MMEVASLDDKYFASTMVYNQRFYLANVDVWNSLGGFWLCISNKKKKGKDTNTRSNPRPCTIRFRGPNLSPSDLAEHRRRHSDEKILFSP